MIATKITVNNVDAGLKKEIKGRMRNFKTTFKLFDCSIRVYRSS